MMSGFVVFGDIVEENGKTIRQNNREIDHAIPLGSIVTVDFDHTCRSRNGVSIGYSGKATLYVVSHGRDCDGTPLYTLSSEPIAYPGQVGEEYARWRMFVDFHLHNYSEESLTPTGKQADRFYTVQEFINMLRG